MMEELDKLRGARREIAIPRELARIATALETLVEAATAYVQALNEANAALREPSVGEQLREWIETGEVGNPPCGLIEVTTVDQLNRHFKLPNGQEIQYAATREADDHA